MMNHNDNIVLYEMIIIIIVKCVSYGTMIAKLDATVLIVALRVAVSSCRNRRAPSASPFRLCLSRACLGKLTVFIQRRFPHRPDFEVVCPGAASVHREERVNQTCKGAKDVRSAFFL